MKDVEAVFTHVIRVGRIVGLALLLSYLSMACADAGRRGRSEVTSSDPGWKLFRHYDPDFRFLFPERWISKIPKGENVRALVSDPKSTANCNVLVIDKLLIRLLGRALDVSELSAEDLVDREKWPDTRVLEEADISIDNRPARLAVFDMTYSTIEGSFPFRQMVVFAVNESRIYQVTCGAIRSDFEQVRPLFGRVVGTFVFEDWK